MAFVRSLSTVSRHTYASRAAADAKSILWVSRQLGQSSPEHTLRRYIHLLPQEEVDLSFAEISVPKRPYTALPHSSKNPNKNAPDLSGRDDLLQPENSINDLSLSSSDDTRYRLTIWNNRIAKATTKIRSTAIASQSISGVTVIWISREAD